MLMLTCLTIVGRNTEMLIHVPAKKDQETEIFLSIEIGITSEVNLRPKSRRVPQLYRGLSLLSPALSSTNRSG